MDIQKQGASFFKIFQILTYANDHKKAGHMLTLPFQAISSLKKCNGNLEDWSKACVDSWKETIEFLNNWKTDKI